MTSTCSLDNFIIPCSFFFYGKYLRWAFETQEAYFSYLSTIIPRYPKSVALEIPFSSFAFSSFYSYPRLGTTLPVAGSLLLS